MFNEKTTLIILLVILVFALIGCKGLLDKEEYIDKTLGVNIKIEPKVSTNSVSHKLSRKHLNHLKNNILNKIKNNIDMKVYSISDLKGDNKFDYVLIINVKDIEYTSEVKMKTKEKPEVEMEHSCKAYIIYRMLEKGSNNKVTSYEGFVNSIEKTDPNMNEKPKDEFIESKLKYIEKTIIKSLRDVIGY